MTSQIPHPVKSCDVMIMIDASKSFRISFFSYISDWISNLLRSLPPSTNIQVSVAFFINNSTFQPSNFTSNFQKIRNFLQTTWLSGQRTPNVPLQVLGDRLLGNRKNVRKVVVMLSGVSSYKQINVSVFQQLKSSGVIILAVSIGRRLDREILSEISSNSKNEIFFVKNVKNLPKNRFYIQREILYNFTSETFQRNCISGISVASSRSKDLAIGLRGFDQRNGDVAIYNFTTRGRQTQFLQPSNLVKKWRQSHDFMTSSNNNTNDVIDLSNFG